MKLLIRQATIIHSSYTGTGNKKDILIHNGIIEKIANDIQDTDAKILAGNDLHVSIGWMDIFADFADPGHEYRETLETGAEAAAAGGYTDVMLIPNTKPALSEKGQIEYIIRKSALLPVTLYPIGCITQQAEGKLLAEMYDMHQSGAIAFSDGLLPVQHSGILLKALQYVLANGASIIQLPQDKSLGAKGLMNEGLMSTRLGLPGIPAIAEELMINRDIELLRYSNSKLHITGVSTQKGIELISAAKKEGLSITCSVTPYHACFCDEDLADYNTNLKLNPVLRNRQDMMAIRKAIGENVVDCICSQHLPLHSDDKDCEFEYALPGIAGIETVYGAVSPFLTVEKWIEKVTLAPRKIFGIPIPEIKEGAAATLTVFEPHETLIWQKENIRSKSFNNPFIGKKLTGIVKAIINKNQVRINN